MSRNQHIEALKGNRKEPFISIAKEHVADFDSKIYVEEGIVRWKNNHRVPPVELLALWQYVEKEFDFDKSVTIQKEETKRFLGDYAVKSKHRALSNEELYEMMAAHGKGTRVVDIASGRVIQL